MKISEEELRQIIIEEIENMDEGLWDQFKGTLSGVGSAITAPIGSKRRGYKRGKAASALKTASLDLNKVREELVKNIEGLFKPVGGDKAKVDDSMADVVAKWKQAIKTIDQSANLLMSLSQDIKYSATHKPMRRRALDLEVSEGEDKE